MERTILPVTMLSSIPVCGCNIERNIVDIIDHDEFDTGISGSWNESGGKLAFLPGNKLEVNLFIKK